MRCTYVYETDICACIDPKPSIERQPRDQNGQRLIDLDYVPYTILDRVLSRLNTSTTSGAKGSFQVQIAFTREVRPETITLELTMRGLSSMEFAPLSSAYSLLAFPFLPSTHPSSNEGIRRSKSTTPLQITLPELIRRLEQHRFSIVSVTDVSKERAEELWDEVRRLDGEVRTVGVDENLDEWRERREMGLRRAWEAGLLEGGMLTRWRVVVVVGGRGKEIR